MSEKNLSRRVGLFVLAGLVLLAALMLVFSKGTLFARKAYTIYLQTPNVGGIKPGASVMMAGVPIGHVSDADMNDDGREVLLTLKIYAKYPIRSSAKFAIDQAGFLGDQFVTVDPRENRGVLLAEGDKRQCEAPFNLQETARRAGEVLERVSLAVDHINDAISNVSNILLDPQQLAELSTNLGATVSNLKTTAINLRLVSDTARTNVTPVLTNLQLLSGSALNVVSNVDKLVLSQTASVARVLWNLDTAGSNVARFSESLQRTGDRAESLVVSNGELLTISMRQVEMATGQATNLLASLQSDLDAGKGLLGALMRDDRMRQKTDQMLDHMNELSGNIAVASSNLNRNGLWWLLWEPKQPKTNKTAKAVPAGAGKP